MQLCSRPKLRGQGIPGAPAAPGGGPEPTRPPLFTSDSSSDIPSPPQPPVSTSHTALLNSPLSSAIYYLSPQSDWGEALLPGRCYIGEKRPALVGGGQLRARDQGGDVPGRWLSPGA